MLLRCKGQGKKGASGSKYAPSRQAEDTRAGPTVKIKEDEDSMVISCPCIGIGKSASVGFRTRKPPVQAGLGALR
jgi:hypothetical protein